MNAQDTFITAANVAREVLNPEGRANATGATLEEIALLPKMNFCLTPQDLSVGLCVIWSHYAAEHNQVNDLDPGEAGRRKSRAKTLREIAEGLAAPASDDWQKSRARCLAAWSVAAGIGGDNPRAMAIRTTWSREMKFLAD